MGALQPLRELPNPNRRAARAEVGCQTGVARAEPWTLSAATMGARGTRGHGSVNGNPGGAQLVGIRMILL